jgi:superfamily II DNA or RNA helicase
MKNLLETIIDGKSYEDLGNWCLPNLSKFSDNKNLFEYQNKAIRNITKTLHEYFTEERGKQHLFDLYKSHGLENRSYAVEKYASKTEKQNSKINSRFRLFQNHFKVLGNSWDSGEYISGSNFMNRACFWMATGSGKSLVLIKTIELLDYLQSQNLIPKKEIMLLLPREDLIKQFTKEITEFNKGRERQIELINLKKYEDDKQGFAFDNSIKVYYYRSDLVRDERKETILDYRSYENNGNWYVFLDEAHRGGKEDSLMQDYVSILSKNGFSFNFSATFTDSIDYLTTCYNFNLEKFILAGYGKNLYLSQSYFNFTKDKDDFNEREKQKQVLKSLITFALVKKQKKENSYHHPLLITLVNSINTDDADLLLFFNKLEEIAGGHIEEQLFTEAKNELVQDLRNHASFVFGDEQLNFDISLAENITLQDIFEQVFNAKNHGKIEILEGEKGKEIALRLQNTEKPFALIKIGDTGKFKREQLGTNYEVIPSFDSKRYFEKINQSEDINLLLGSRSFYEGWDSNRPNVINMINIGKSDAKKFVLQGIGRGIRIEPLQGERKRLPQNHPNKNVLLETLFVFATDKNAVKAIVETVQEQKNTIEQEISLFENPTKLFDLLIPIYKDEKSRGKIAKFNIASESLEIFKHFIASFDTNALLLKIGISKPDLEFLLNWIQNSSSFQIQDKNIFYDMDLLLQRLANHISIKQKTVSGIKEISDEIIHFKHIKVVNFSDEEVSSFKQKIGKVRDFEAIDKKGIEAKIKSGELSFEQALKLGNATSEESFKDLKIKKIAEHYYLPLIYSENEKVEYIKHIIDVPSEVQFIKNLEKHIKENKPDCQWMFSKIDQNLDTFHIPYFYKKENIYRKFFPDFIFWMKKDESYKIVFVDPKGTSNADYQNKVDEFEKLFFENEQAKVFEYKNFIITFDLKLVASDVNSVSDKYEKYWLGNNDFSFLKSLNQP